MITPEQLRKKAANQYRKLQLAWLDSDESFFPRTIPSNRSLPKDASDSIRAVNLLRNGSKEVLGYGYSIEWSNEIRSRIHGRNRLPRKLFFESREDLLRFIGMSDDFSAFSAAVTRLRTALQIDSEAATRLEEWFRSHSVLLTEAALEIEEMILVIQYFLDHPRPDVFARELPIPVDTKFVERNKRILSHLFDLLLPAQAIRADETHFERRYGLRYAEPLILVRLLDPGLREKLHVPFEELGLPLSALAALPITNARVFLVENKVSLLTLPTSPLQTNGIALGALGAASTVLRDVKWLENVPVYYWGDIDVEGLKILADVRKIFPHVQSMLMTDQTLRRWSEFAVPGSGKAIPEPAGLSKDELSAFWHCCDNNLRLEQERIPVTSVMEALREL